jgi:adenylate cyclase
LIRPIIPLGLGWVHVLVPMNKLDSLPLERHYQARLGMGIMVLAVCMSLILVLVETSLGRPGHAAVNAVMAPGWVALIVLLRAQAHRLTLVNHLAVSIIVVGSGVQTWLSGGIWASGGVTLWALIAPLVTTLVVGRDPGRYWLWVVLAMFGILGMLGGTPDLGVAAPVFTANLMLFSVMLFLVMQWFVEQRELAESEVRRERARADGLLNDILPAGVVERLKHGETVADQLQDVTVLFADVVGFTQLAAVHPASDMLDLLGDLFGDIDDLVARHGVEKIKTIGDSYMIAAGAPEPLADGSERLARLALDLVGVIRDRTNHGGPPIDIRIGIHCGDVMAGVVGESRFGYDLWGDTVNVASRMETTGEPGKIQVTESLKAALGSSFEFQSRGAVSVKGKGEMQTWWLTGLT